MKNRYSLAEYSMINHSDSNIFSKWKYIKENGKLSYDQLVLVKKFCDNSHTFRDVLQKINTYVNNQFRYYLDTEDKWMTPQEFVKEGGGDCEDFAITKYFMVKEAIKIKEQTDTDKCIMIAIGKQIFTRIFHAVLLVQTRFGYYMLDNAEDAIYNTGSVYWFEPIYGLCPKKWVIFNSPLVNE